ncbi:MAG: hypothetical protein EPO01_01370 [Aquabacterium sp.]|nr:MAG: hypothetical protein EPO01_01370 [Aquabacterium sp.]
MHPTIPRPETLIRRLRVVLSRVGLGVLVNAGTLITAVAQPAALFWQQSEDYVAGPSTNGVCTVFIGYPVKQLSPSVREFEVRQHPLNVLNSARPCRQCRRGRSAAAVDAPTTLPVAGYAALWGASARPSGCLSAGDNTSNSLARRLTCA